MSHVGHVRLLNNYILKPCVIVTFLCDKNAVALILTQSVYIYVMVNVGKLENYN